MLGLQGTFCLGAVSPRLAGCQIVPRLRRWSGIILPFQNLPGSGREGCVGSGGVINFFACISQTKEASCFEMSGARSRCKNNSAKIRSSGLSEGKRAGAPGGSGLRSGCGLSPREGPSCSRGWEHSHPRIPRHPPTTTTSPTYELFLLAAPAEPPCLSAARRSHMEELSSQDQNHGSQCGCLKTNPLGKRQQTTFWKRD